jgi:hypothetical protein
MGKSDDMSFILVGNASFYFIFSKKFRADDSCNKKKRAQSPGPDRLSDPTISDFCLFLFLFSNFFLMNAFFL